MAPKLGIWDEPNSSIANRVVHFSEISMGCDSTNCQEKSEYIFDHIECPQFSQWYAIPSRSLEMAPKQGVWDEQKSSMANRLVHSNEISM